MAKTVVDIDDELLDKARVLLGTRTKRDTVTTALRQVVERVERLELLDYLTNGPFDLEVARDRDALWRR